MSGKKEVKMHSMIKALRRNLAISIAPILLLAYLINTVMPTVAEAEIKEIVDNEVKTISGVLQLIRVQETRPEWRYGENTYKITLGGKLLFRPPVEYVEIEAAYPSKFDARYILLGTSHGGNACAGFYQIIEIAGNGNVLVTEEFGNCDSPAKTSYTNGVLRVDLPDAGGKKGGVATWLYSDGKLTEVARLGRKSLTVSESYANPQTLTDSGLLTSDEGSYFINEWLRLSEVSFEAVMEMYDGEVDYYKFGKVSKSIVGGDKKKYFERWPVRKHMIKALKLSPGDEANKKKVELVFHYKISDGKKSLQGDAETILVLWKWNGKILIVSEKAR
jgi:hypothetical protein